MANYASSLLASRRICSARRGMPIPTYYYSPPAVRTVWRCFAHDNPKLAFFLITHLEDFQPHEGVLSLEPKMTEDAKLTS